MAEILEMLVSFFSLIVDLVVSVFVKKYIKENKNDVTRVTSFLFKYVLQDIVDR